MLPLFDEHEPSEAAQPFQGLTLRDHIPGGLGHEPEAFRRAAREWTPDRAAGWDDEDERRQWTRPSVELPP